MLVVVGHFGLGFFFFFNSLLSPSALHFLVKNLKNEKLVSLVQNQFRMEQFGHGRVQFILFYNISYEPKFYTLQCLYSSTRQLSESGQALNIHL